MKTSTAIDTDAVRNVLQSLRLRLERERDRVCCEIRDYPTPIPRCDAQFNHLIEQRDSLVRELRRLEGGAGVRSAAEANRLIGALIDESGLSDAVKQDLLSIIRAGRPDPALR